MNQPGSTVGAWRWRLASLPPAELAKRLRAESEAAGRARTPVRASAERSRSRLGRGMAAPDTTDEILDVNRRYHDVAAAEYDAKWGVDFGEVGRAQVLGKVRKLLGRDPGPFARSLEIGSGTGYFTLNLMQSGVIASAVCTDVSPGMLETLARQRAAARPGRARPSRATRRPCRSRTRRSTSCSATRCCTTCRSSGARSPSSGACCARAACCCSPASRRATATASPPCPSAPAWRAAPLWRRLVGARAVNGYGDARRPTTTRWSRWSTCTPSRPATSSATRAAPGSPTCACAARSCSPTGSAGSTAPSRPARSTTTSRTAGSATPTAATSRCRRSTRPCSSRTCRAAGFYNLMLAARKPLSG